MSHEPTFDVNNAIKQINLYRCYSCYNRETQAVFGLEGATDFCYSATESKFLPSWWLEQYPELDHTMWKNFYKWIDESSQARRMCTECMVELDNTLVRSWEQMQAAA